MARRKMWTLLGHSMGEGLAGTTQMYTEARWLLPFGGTGSPSDGLPFTPTIERRVYNNIFAWTAKAGFSGSGGTPPNFSPGAGQWLQMTTEFPTSPAFPHPYTSPFNYPNTRSLPLSPPLYVASSAGAFASDAGGGSYVGIELPLSWKLSHYWTEDVYFLKLAIPASFFFRHERGFFSTPILNALGIPTSALGAEYPGGLSSYYSWFTPADRFDFQPNTGRLYQTWKDRMTAAAAEAAADSPADSLDMRLVILWFGDNDCREADANVASVSPSRVRDFEDIYRAFIDQIRRDLVDNNWTSLPEHKIPIIGMGIQRAYGNTPTQDAMNQALENIQRDDPWFRTKDVNQYQTLLQAGYSDASHLSHRGYIFAANDVFDDYVEMETAGEDALARDIRVSLSDVRDRVSTYYERNRTTTNASETALNQHINGALFHILNKVSDSAWWLRQIHPLSISSGPTTTFSLPRHVHRILRIERAAEPGYPLRFEMTGFTDAGRMQILMKEAYVGTHNVHFITQPKELTRDDELVPLPYNLVEWLVVEAARRLARSSGNLPLHESLTLEARELKDDCMRNIHAVRRPAQDRLHGQRRLPSGRSYGRRWWGF